MVALNGPAYIPQKAAKYALIILHGFGDSGEGIISVGPMLHNLLPQNIAEHTAIFAPNGPEPTPFGEGYQWFGDANFTFRNRPGIGTAQKLIENFIQTEVVEAHNIPWNNIILIGFSQGMMTTTFAAPRFKNKIAAQVGLSGRLLWQEELQDQPHHKLPTLIVHGLADDVVPADKAVEAANALSALNFPTEHHLLDDLGHGIDERVLDLAANFITSHLQ